MVLGKLIFNLIYLNHTSIYFSNKFHRNLFGVVLGKFKELTISANSL
jgi:hypothetical protein